MEYNSKSKYIKDISFTTLQLLENKKYKLNNNNNEKVIIFNSPNISVINPFVDSDYILKGFHGNFVLECVNRIIKVIPQDNLGLFYNNINRLNTEHREFRKYNFFHTNKHVGDYNIKLFRIRVQKRDYYLIIPHELFHLASSYFDENQQIIYSGFYQYYGHTNKAFGRSFNEGYTQGLTNRYFISSSSYFLETHFALILEEIIGQSKMEEFYFKADLKGLVKKLNNYEDEDYIIKFIECFDHINIFKNKNNIIKMNVEFIVDFLVDCYINKLKEMVQNKIIEPIDMYIYFSNYLTKLGSNINLKNKSYNYFNTGKLFFNLDKINEIVKQKRLDNLLY